MQDTLRDTDPMGLSSTVEVWDRCNPSGGTPFFIDKSGGIPYPPTPLFYASKQGVPPHPTPPVFTSEHGVALPPHPALGCARNIVKIIWEFHIYAFASAWVFLWHTFCSEWVQMFAHCGDKNSMGYFVYIKGDGYYLWCV